MHGLNACTEEEVRRSCRCIAAAEAEDGAERMSSWGAILRVYCCMVNRGKNIQENNFCSRQEWRLDRDTTYTCLL